MDESTKRSKMYGLRTLMKDLEHAGIASFMKHDIASSPEEPELVIHFRDTPYIFCVVTEVSDRSSPFYYFDLSYSWPFNCVFVNHGRSSIDGVVEILKDFMSDDVRAMERLKPALTKLSSSYTDCANMYEQIVKAKNKGERKMPIDKAGEWSATFSGTLFVSQRMPEIKDVIFNDPATIVIWEDGTKTVVKCGEGDVFDPEKGLALAISKKALGNKHEYYEPFKKYVGRYSKKQSKEKKS